MGMSKRGLEVLSAVMVNTGGLPSSETVTLFIRFESLSAVVRRRVTAWSTALSNLHNQNLEVVWVFYL